MFQGNTLTCPKSLLAMELKSLYGKTPNRRETSQTAMNCKSLFRQERTRFPSFPGELCRTLLLHNRRGRQDNAGGLFGRRLLETVQEPEKREAGNQQSEDFELEAEEGQG